MFPLPPEFGHTVLRFLAEALARDLDTILDVILRSVADAEFPKPFNRSRGVVASPCRVASAHMHEVATEAA
jgi:hypothetical protein